MSRYPQLVIDVGNSFIKVGLFDDKTVPASALPTCQQSWTIGASSDVDWPAIDGLFDRRPQRRAWIAGSNPAGMTRVIDSWPGDWDAPPQQVERERDIELAVNVDFPERVGIDRLLNAMAVNRIRPHNRPAIVVAVGTATTVNYTSADGVFQGGAILPGLELCSRALHDYTALLPLISYEELAAEETLAAIGKNTESAIKVGLLFGQVGAIKETIARMDHEADNQRAQVYLTGGGSPLLKPYFPKATWEPHLSLQALAIIAHKAVPL